MELMVQWRKVGARPPFLLSFFLSRPLDVAMPVSMTNDTEKNSKKGSMRKAFGPAKGTGKPVLFLPEEMDIYCNKVTKETFVFHGKDVDYDSLERAEYNPKDHTVEIFKKDGTSVDLGVKIQWLLRPYFTKSTEIQIVQTLNGQAINGTFIPLTHKGK